MIQLRLEEGADLSSLWTEREDAVNNMRPRRQDTEFPV